MSKKSPLGTVGAAVSLGSTAGPRKQMQIGRLMGIGLEEKPRPEVGYMARMLVICTMPHSDAHLPEGASVKRTNGDYTLYIQPAPNKGVPYGMYPRLIMAWMTQEVQRTRSRELNLGNSFTEFMRDIGVEATTGKRGTMKNMREQMERLLSSRIWIAHENEDFSDVRTISVADEWQLWWRPSMGENQDSLFPSRVVLGDRLYSDMINNPIPFDKRVIRAIGANPLAFDLYMWLGQRVSYLKEPTMISYAQLAGQVGADYSDLKNFGRKVREALTVLAVAWPQLNYHTPKGRLALYPSSTHVPRKGLPESRRK